MAHSMVELPNGNIGSRTTFIVFDWGDNKKIHVEAKTKADAENIHIARWEKQLGTVTAASTTARDSTARAFKKLKKPTWAAAEIAGSDLQSSSHDFDGNQSSSINITTSPLAAAAVVGGDSDGSRNSDDGFFFGSMSKSNSSGTLSAVMGGGGDADVRFRNGVAKETNSPSDRRCTSPPAAASRDGSDDDCTTRSGSVPAAAVTTSSRGCGGYRFTAHTSNNVNVSSPSSSSVAASVAYGSHSCGGDRFRVGPSCPPPSGLPRSLSAVAGVGAGTGYNNDGENSTGSLESGSGSSSAPDSEGGSSDRSDSDGSSGCRSRTFDSYNSWVDSSDGSGRDPGGSGVGLAGSINDYDDSDDRDDSDDHDESDDHGDSDDLDDSDSGSSGDSSSRRSSLGATEGTIGFDGTVSSPYSHSRPAAEAVAIDDYMNGARARNMASPTGAAKAIGSGQSGRLCSSNSGVVTAGTGSDGPGRCICSSICTATEAVVGGGSRYGGGSGDKNTGTSTLPRVQTMVGEASGGRSHSCLGNGNRSGPGHVAAVSSSGTFDTRRHSSGLPTEAAAAVGGGHGSSSACVSTPVARAVAGGAGQEPEQPLSPDDPNHSTDKALMVAFLHTLDEEVWHAVVSLEQSAHDKQ